MVVGSYPCCDGNLMIAVPDVTPAFKRELCPHCGEAVWHRLSRLDPQSWTEAAFLEEYDVNEEAGTIERRHWA